jgi:hypothetical protein
LDRLERKTLNPHDSSLVDILLKHGHSWGRGSGYLRFENTFISFLENVVDTPGAFDRN